MYDIYNTENSNLSITDCILISQGNLVDTKTKRYSKETYGIYNEGNISITRGNIQVSNVFNKAYGIQVKKGGYVNIDDTDIIISQTGTNSGSSIPYGIDNLGQIEYTNSRIEVNGYFNVYGINNGKDTNVTINSGSINANHTKETANNAYGIKNEGILNIIDAQINATIVESGSAYGIDNSAVGIVTLGDSSRNKLNLYFTH